MKMNAENLANTVNAWAFGVSVLWTMMMITVVSNAGYGDTDVKWGFLSLCILFEVIGTYSVTTHLHQYAVDKYHDNGMTGYIQSVKQGVVEASTDMREAKLARVYLGYFFKLWSFICFVVCGCIWIFL
jgi:hypothetical protein